MRLVLLLFLAACTDEGGDGKIARPGDAGAPDTGFTPGFDVNAVAAEIAGAQCAYVSRCVPEYYDSTGTNEATCTAEGTAALVEGFDSIREELAAGRIRYDETQKGLCVQALQTASCLFGIGDDSPCDRVLLGTQPSDAPCFFSDECAPGLYCNRPQGIGSCGTCARRPDRGESCDPFTPCQPNTRCLDISGTSLCIPIDAPQGGECLTLETGLCEGNLSCVGNEMTGFTCQPPSGQGATCDLMTFEFPDCNGSEGWACVNGACAEAHWADLAGTCGPDTFCREGWCNQGTCVELPGLGQSCATTGACSGDAFCDAQDQCRPQRAAGQSCRSGVECIGDLLCVGAGVGRPGTCGEVSFMLCE